MSSGRHLFVIAFVSISIVCGLVVASAGEPETAAAASRQPAHSRDIGSIAETLPAPNVSASGAYTVSLPVVFMDYTTPLASLFGVQMYGGLSEQSMALSLASRARVSWVRWPIHWASIESTNTTPDNFDWSSIDASIANTSHANLQIIGTLSGNPSWAATLANGPIDIAPLSEFAEFVAAVVERYDGDGNQDAPGSPVITYWEFYNEPDAANRWAAEQGYGSYWGPYGDLYAEMLCAVYPALRSANPNARQTLGGIAYDSFQEEGGSFVREFLGEVLENGGGNCLDVMNFHYYPWFDARWSPHGNGLMGKANYLRENYPEISSKPMVVTEAGWHSDDTYPTMPSTDEIQSRYVAQVFAQATALDLDSLIWWTWVDPSPPYTENGLLTQDLTPKPSYDAYTTSVNKIGAAEFVKEMSVSENIEGYQFISRRDTTLYVLWATDDQTHVVAVNGETAERTSMYGDNTTILSDGSDGVNDNRITTTVGANPIYLEIQ